MTAHAKPSARRKSTNVFIINCPTKYSFFSCRDRCEAKRMTGTVKGVWVKCHCDPYCERFNDCCADFDKFCQGIVTQKKLTTPWKCIDYNGLLKDPVWMISSCPTQSSDLVLKTRCENSESILPFNYINVFPVASQHGGIYKNRFCALCHGASLSDIKYLELRSDWCSLSPQHHSLNFRNQLKTAFKVCSKNTFELYSNDVQLRACFKTSDKCTFQHEVDQAACKTQPARIVYVDSVKRYFKNIYCARCSIPHFDNHQALCSHFQGLLPGENIPNLFMAILDIDDKNIKNGFEDVSRTVTRKCPKGQVYDVFLETCRNTFPLGKLKLLTLYKYNITMWLRTNRSSGFYNLNYLFLTNSFSTFLGVENKSISVLEKTLIQKNLIVVTLDFSVHLKDEDQTKNNINQKHLLNLMNFTHPIDLRVSNDIVSVIKATVKGLACVTIEYYSPQDYVILPNSSGVYINKTREFLSQKQYFFNDILLQSDKLITDGTIAVCRQNAVNECLNETIILQENEYVMLPNKSVYRNISGIVYEEDEYWKFNGSLFVCGNYSNEYSTTLKHGSQTKGPSVLVILNFICLLLSVVCLTFILVTYALFEELRTLPGINLMNLSSALFLGHFFWLIGSNRPESPRVCAAMAAILHFAFLASFAWMSIIAFCTWKTFSGSGVVGANKDKRSRRKHVIRVLSIGWLPVFLFVVICVFLDQFRVVAIDYGGSKGCWINNVHAQLYLFVVPVSMGVLWNAVFFGMTVRAISKSRKEASRARRQHENQQRFRVYVKIATLKGFTWIFGFLALLVSEYFEYPFVIFSTLQGLYIAAAFTFNSRIKKLYQHRFFGKNSVTQSKDHIKTATKRV